MFVFISFLYIYSPICITLQVGHDKEGLPIGIQLIGRPWGEATILRVASAIEVSSFFYSVESFKFELQTQKTFSWSSVHLFYFQKTINQFQFATFVVFLHAEALSFFKEKA